jgi:hypothetical protein
MAARAGNGSEGRPWDLATALGHPAAVQPGDTIWVRGGTYGGSFVSTLAGTVSAPIVVRGYPGEHATISGGIDVRGGGYVWLWGLELANLDPQLEAYGVAVLAPGVRLINLIIHDHGAGGLGVWETASDAEAYGNIVYNNGAIGSVPGVTFGHGIYTQNDAGSKLFAENVLFNQYGLGFSAYGEEGLVRNMRFEGNVSFNNNQPDILVQGGSPPIAGIVLTENMTYRSNGALSIILGRHRGQIHEDVVVTNNYFGGMVTVARWNRVTFTNNTLRAADKLELHTAQATVPEGYVWNNNDYLMTRDHCGGTCPFGTVMAGTAVNYTDLTRWQAATGLDPNSEAAQSPSGRPSGLRVFVRSNAYERGRGHVIVYNWDQAATVTVSLSSILTSGDQFEVYNVQDLFGNPVASGTYAGGSVSLPMTGVSAPPPIGGGSFRNTGPDFHVFLVKLARQ